MPRIPSIHIRNPRTRLTLGTTSTSVINGALAETPTTPPLENNNQMRATVRPTKSSRKKRQPVPRDATAPHDAIVLRDAVRVAAKATARVAVRARKARKAVRAVRATRAEDTEDKPNPVKGILQTPIYEIAMSQIIP